MFPYIDSSDVVAVEAYAAQVFKTMFPRVRGTWLRRVFADVDDLFRGRHPSYAAIDSKYHDFQHTLQATVCLVTLLEGRRLAGVRPVLHARQFELAVAATLLHDTGFLRHRTDTGGTAGRYTYCHIVRSGAFVASYLPTIGADSFEVETVLGAINCTGPNLELSRLWFRQPADRITGAALATADYLAQMADPRYPDKLEFLFQEFHESEEFLHVAPERRAFASARELLAKTPEFWARTVRPKLEHEFHGLYRYLARPSPDGANAYLQAIEANLGVIRQRLRNSPAPRAAAAL